MKLYHGTAAKHIPSIIVNGVRPRGARTSSNWGECPSKPDLVYLTAAYPIYFAFHAVATPITKASRLAIVEVETDLLDQEHLCPDEDYVAQALHRADHAAGKPAMSLHDRTNDIDPTTWRHEFENSVKYLGQCCHIGAIPMSAITRIAAFAIGDCPQIVSRSLEPTITVDNYRLCGEDYRTLAAFIFGETDIPVADSMMERAFALFEPADVVAVQTRERTARFLAEREKIEIVDLRRSFVE